LHRFLKIEDHATMLGRLSNTVQKQWQDMFLKLVRSDLTRTIGKMVSFMFLKLVRSNLTRTLFKHCDNAQKWKQVF